MARIVLGGPGSDPERVARALRDAGHEVVLAAGYDAAGLATAVLHEDADLVVSVGGSLEELRDALAGRGVAEVPARLADGSEPSTTVHWAAAYRD